MPPERRVIAVSGLVQGVGFRPFVYRLASRLLLGGFVQNQPEGVRIEIEGSSDQLDHFLARLAGEAPALAWIAALSWESRPARGDRAFRIQPSSSDHGVCSFVSPDVATCDACLADLARTADRRHGYPFLSCAECGPRLTVIEGSPYDRERTTLSSFPLCHDCREEYEEPSNRRFHAQSIACPRCGPELRLDGEAGNAGDPLSGFARALAGGAIGALKGLGGYHLACLAEDEAAVSELRRRKRRYQKPFAIMVPSLAVAQRLCAISAAERELLESWRRPIVLLKRRRGAAVAESVAPGNSHLGVMLPYTPVHHLLLQALDRPLVMTSGNRSDEPIAYRDEEARERLSGICDVFLSHNRAIHVRCDDSVTRIIAGRETLLRRARGYAPQPIVLPFAAPEPILAVGAFLKSTFTLVSQRSAFLSHHLGDLDDAATCESFVSAVDLYQSLFSITPRTVAYDLHPDFPSTRYAHGRAATRVAVQHHHAHMAACMAENGLVETVIGVTWDGIGLGTDGAAWGGEFLVGDYRSFRRAAHLGYVGMPGGDAAVRHPWRMAVAHLQAAQVTDHRLRDRQDPGEWRTIRSMLEKDIRCPPTSSMGRLFDAVAAIIGVRDSVSFEGQAAIELEALADDVPADGSYAFGYAQSRPSEGALEVDCRPVIRALVDDLSRDTAPAVAARRFHSAVVSMMVEVCLRIRRMSGISAVVLSGGCFMNRILTEEASAELAAHDFRVYRHHRVPPNDGGLSLGQAAVAAARGMEGASLCA